MRIGKETVIGEADRTVCLTFLNMSDRLMRNLEPKHGLLSFLLKALPGRLAQAKPIGSWFSTAKKGVQMGEY